MAQIANGESLATTRTKINGVIDKIEGNDTIDNALTIDGDLTVDTTTLHVDSTNNRVGIGTSSPTATLTVSATNGNGIFVEDSSASSAAPSVNVRGKRGDANASPSFSGKLLLDGHRTDAAVGTNKSLGTVAFGGNHTDGSDANILYPASISGVAEGTFSNSTTMPTALAFYTGSTGRADTTANVYFGSEAMRIDSDGNVGIGTTSPSEALTVSGNFSLDTAASDVIFTAGNSSSNRVIAVDGSGDERAAVEFLGVASNQTTEIAFYTSDTVTTMAEVMRIDNSGNVGIGTSSPGYKLESAGTVAVKNTNPTLKIIDTDGTSTHSIVDESVNNDIWYHSTRTSSDAFAGFNYLMGLGSSGANLHRWYINGSEKARLNTNGLGIGTSSPLSQLHVYGTGQTTANVADAGNQGGFLRVSDAGSAGGSGGGILFTNVQADNAGSVGMAAIKGILANGSGNTVGNLSFSTRASTTDTSLTERMRITNTGNVGIGTSSPVNNLDVSADDEFTTVNVRTYSSINSTYSSGLNLRRSRGTEASPAYPLSGDYLGAINFRNASSSGTYGSRILSSATENHSATDNGSDLQFYVNPDGGTRSEAMRISSDGNVGIGTSSPGSKLSIVGLPTSATGLSAGDVYNDGGTLKIV